MAARSQAFGIKVDTSSLTTLLGGMSQLDGAALAGLLGLEVHAGHGLTFENVKPVAAIPQLAELNIGHFLIGEAIFVGLDGAIEKMRAAMDAGRAEIGG